MSYSALDGTPLVPLGVDTMFLGNSGISNNNTVTIDAANEAVHLIGHVITSDGGSHTIDTTGSSSLQWRASTVTFANAGTTLKVGLGTVDATTGPVTRATNVADVVTYSVSKSLTGGGGGVTGSAWQTHAPDTGSLSVANGDLLAFTVQMTARGGADSILMQNNGSSGYQRPVVTTFTGGSYAAQTSVPNCIIVFSDGALGWFNGGSVYTTPSTTQTWNSGSATVEYGNYILRPYPMKVYGIICNANFTADCDLVLYSAPLGTPVAQKTISVDTNQTEVAGLRWGYYLFSSPYSAMANEPLAAIFKPGASNVSATYKTYNASAHGITEIGGTNIYAVNRASGAFAAQNSNKDKFGIGLLVGAFSQENNMLINSGALVG